MRKFKDVNELVNELKPDYPVYCIRPESIKRSTRQLLLMLRELGQIRSQRSGL